MLRKAIAEGTDLGRSAKSFMDNGELVPDAVVVGIVDERLKESDCAAGFILDGFPRTTGQAEALGAAGVSIDRVVHIAVGEEALVERLAGRRSCISCGAMFHVLFAAPTQDGICDSCGGELVQRADDNPKTVRDRLRVYSDKTAPLVEFYSAEGNLVTVDGEGATQAITGRITAALGGTS
jgi:adenylate kinase